MFLNIDLSLMIYEMLKVNLLFLKYIAKPLYKFFYLNPRVKVVLDDNGELNKMKGPALIVGNHSHSLDPIFMYTAMKVHVSWVAGAYLFKTKFMNFALTKIANCIPKQQGRSDLKTIKAIDTALKEKTIVGLFPEGTRTWDGNSLDINHKATAKLFRIFKVPVYFVSLEGAYDLHPRWADYKRRGILVVKLKKILSAEDIKESSTKELTSIVKENLSFNHTKWQEKTQRPFYCRKNAHGIQRLFYICPKCHHLQTITGHNNIISCSNCKTEDVLSDTLRLKNGSFGFETLPEWNSFQQEYIKSHNLAFKEDKGDFFRKGEGNNKFSMISTNYSCCLNEDSITFTLSDGEKFVYDIEKIESMVLSVRQSIEFYYENKLYSFRLQPELNSLKYYQKWEIVYAKV